MAKQRVIFLGMLFFLASMWFGSSCLTLQSYLMQILSAFATIMCGVVAFISFHLATHICGNDMSLEECIKLYFHGLYSMMIAKQRLRSFKNDTKCPLKLQEKTLMTILNRNAETEYGRNMGFEDISTIDEFRKRHPLSDYKQFEEYIERTAKGEHNVIIPNRPELLVLTSGTTGKPKMIPRSKKPRSHPHLVEKPVCSGALREAGIHSKYLTQKVCQLYTHPHTYKSEAGINMSVGTRWTRKNILPTWVSPPAAFEISSDKDAMYIHAIFALKDEHLSAIRTTFCTNICAFFQGIENNWRKMVTDISTGTINADLDIPSYVRNELSAILKPDPIRAEQIRKEFERGFDGIATRVWPHLMHMFAIVPECFKIYADVIEKYAKGVVLYSPMYISSEGLHALNLWPGKRQYLFCTDMEFFEFIPFNKSEESQPTTCLIDELEEGESYELVITNSDGLYRFRFGDVIKVVGYYNKSPIVEVQFRIGDLINLRGEKTTEDQLRRAIFDTVALWDVQLADYSCAEDHLLEAAQGLKKTADLPYYVIFMEIQQKSGPNKEDKLDTKIFDKCLRDIASIYDLERKMDSIGPAKVIFLQPGSFENLRNYILENSTAGVINFKMPRKLRRKEWIQMLLNNLND